MQKLLSIFLFSFLFLFICNVNRAFAASSTIGLSPQSGSYGKPFTVDLVIDGHGDKFNAAQATVNLSSNLAIQNLVLGDCNFSFLKTPSIQNPSFAGVILGTYATKCTVYTFTLAPVTKGNASITLSTSSVRQFGDAANILSATYNGTYILTAALKSSIALGNQQMKNTSQDGLYTLYLKIYSSNTTPVSDATVILNQVSMKNKQQAISDSTGTAHFSNLQTGIYDATIMENSIKVGESVINVNGSNHILALGVNIAAQKKNPLLKNTNSLFNSLTTSPTFLVTILIIGIIVGVGIALFVIKLVGRKK